MIATQELVVPKSMPIVFAMLKTPLKTLEKNLCEETVGAVYVVGVVRFKGGLNFAVNLSYG